MFTRAKLYVASVIALGACVLLHQMLQWDSQDPVRLIGCLAITILAARLQMKLPGMHGAMSAYFVVLLFGIFQLTIAETLLMGCAAVLVQCWWGPDRPRRLSQILFRFASICITVHTTGIVYHALANSGHVGTGIGVGSAGTVFFGVTSVLAAFATAWSENRRVAKVWRESYFWSFPYYLGGAGVAGLASAANHFIGWQTSLLIVPIVYLVYHSYNMYLARRVDEKKHAEEMTSLHVRTIEALALAIDAKDQTTHDHLERVQTYAVAVGRDLGLSEEQLEALRAAALLHDIGKLAVPEHIISKPGKLTREEFEKMKIHPVVGAEILERVRFPYPVTPIVRSHHEKWDGTGYPDGLKGEEIPIGARILSAVDCLDALASDRQYRKALPLEQAMQRVASEAGSCFDPAVVKVLQGRYVELERMAQASQGDKAHLSTEMEVQRGLEPAAGFENMQQVAPPPSSGESQDFLARIASARQEVQDLFELSQQLGNSLSVHETLSLLAMRLKHMIPYDTLAIYTEHDGKLTARYVNGENSGLFSSLEIPIGQGLSGWVAENRKPIVNGNPSVEPGYLNDETKFTTLRSALAVPLTGLNGEVSVLSLYKVERDAFTRDHLRILLAISPKLAISIENAMKYERAESTSTSDNLTGIPNSRSLFVHLDAELARCRRLCSPLVVLVCDLNGLKQLNDRRGRIAGDRVLRLIAAKLKESCREYDYVARIGGDEFVLVLPGLQDEQVSNKIARLKAITVDAAQDVYEDAPISLTIGYAAYPEDGTDADQLLAEADRRMYVAKQRDRFNVVGVRSFDVTQEATVTWS